jgi:hypothetical protein
MLAKEPSEEAQAAYDEMQAAIAKYFMQILQDDDAAMPNDYIQDWVVVGYQSSITDPMESAGYIIESSSPAPHHTIGLLHRGLAMADTLTGPTIDMSGKDD